MKNLSLLGLLLFLHVAAEPVRNVSWGTLLLLLAIIFVLAVSFSAGLVFLLIRHKRHKADSA